MKREEIRNKLNEIFLKFDKRLREQESYLVKTYQMKLKKYDNICVYISGMNDDTTLIGYVRLKNFLDKVIEGKNFYCIARNPDEWNKDGALERTCFGIDKIYGKRAILFIASSKYKEVISRDLQSDKYQTKIKRVTIQEDLLGILEAYEGFKKKKDRRDRILTLYDCLDDEVSCEILYTKWKLILGGYSFHDDDDERYEFYEKVSEFIPESLINQLDGKSTFLCCGMFTEGIIENIRKITNNCYKKIYIMEVNRLYGEDLKQKMKDDSHIEVITAVPSSQDVRIYFKNSEFKKYDYLADNASDDFIDLRKVDSFAADGIFGESISLIRLDLYGFNLVALDGMAGLLKRFRPIVAIPVYVMFREYSTSELHTTEKENLEDVVEYLKKLIPEYKFLLRRYTGHSVLGETMFAYVEK